MRIKFMILSTSLSLAACAPVGGDLTINGAPAEFSDCEVGDRQGISNAVGVWIDQAPGYLLVQDVDGEAVLYLLQSEESWLGRDFDTTELESVGGCGTAEITQRDYTSAGYYPADGSFELDCTPSVDGTDFTFSGGGEFSNCR